MDLLANGLARDGLDALRVSAKKVVRDALKNLEDKLAGVVEKFRHLSPAEREAVFEEAKKKAARVWVVPARPAKVDLTIYP